MAVGDRIYIADKETLDAVNTRTVDIQSVVGDHMSSLNSMQDKLGSATDAAGTGSIYSYLKSINNGVNSLPSNVGSNREYFTTAELASNKMVLGASTLPQSTSTVFTVQGSGLLYAMAIYAPYNNQADNAMAYSIRVDDTTIASRAFTHSVYAPGSISGFLSEGSLISLPHTFSLPGLQNIVSSEATPTTTAPMTGSLTQSGSALLYLPKPIRFNSLVTVAGSSSTGNTRVCYMYELD